MGGIILLIGFVFSAPPDALTYFTYLRSAHATKDEIARYTCAGVTLQVTHTDTAVTGVSKSIDYKGRAPELVDVYILEGFRGANKIFSTVHPLQNWNVSKKYPQTNEWLHDIPTDIDTAFVINRSEYNRMWDERTYYRESWTIVFDPNQTDRNDVRDLAKCYTQHQDELKKSFHASVSSLVILSSPQNSGQSSGMMRFVDPTSKKSKESVETIYLD